MTPEVYISKYGRAKAKPAGHLKVGDTIIWNGGVTSMVHGDIRIIGSRVQFTEYYDGRLRPRLLSCHRLVGIKES